MERKFWHPEMNKAAKIREELVALREKLRELLDAPVAP